MDFILDSIRDGYGFDSTCQDSVPQALVAFFESDSFEDAIRNVISIGGDCDTTGAITSSLAWTYYDVQSGTYSGWAYNKFDPVMLAIKDQALKFLPQEFIDTADEFHEVCWNRSGTYDRVGICTGILTEEEMPESNKTRSRKDSLEKTPITDLSADIEKALTGFCRKYVFFLEALYRDKELNEMRPGSEKVSMHPEMKINTWPNA